MPQTCCLLEEMVPLRSGLFAIMHVLNGIIILITCSRHFNEQKTNLEAEWHNISHQVNMMKNKYMELKKKIDRFAVCSLTFLNLYTHFFANLDCQF